MSINPSIWLSRPVAGVTTMKMRKGRTVVSAPPAGGSDYLVLRGQQILLRGDTITLRTA